MRQSPFWPQLIRLRDCLCATLDDWGLPEPCFCGVVAGAAVPIDYTGSCTGKQGMAWVRLASVAPMVVYSDTGSPIQCSMPLTATIEVGVVRLAPTLNSRGEPPTVEQQLVAAELTTNDMSAAHSAIACCFAPNSRDVRVLTWNPMGPEGGAVGGAWNIEVDYGF